MLQMPPIHGPDVGNRPGTRFQEPRQTARRCVPFCRAVVVVAVLGFVATPARATDLHYTLMSPSFGGTDSVPYQLEQAQNALIAAHKAAQTAAAKAVVTADPYAPLISSITSQLTALVAHNIADKIVNSQNGDAGTIKSGNVAITYVNSDGQLSVTISSPTGSTTLVIPTGD